MCSMTSTELPRLLQVDTHHYHALADHVFSETHIAVLDESLAAFALRCSLVIWHLVGDGDTPHGRLLLAPQINQGLIIERLEGTQITGLQWISSSATSHLCKRALPAMLLVLTTNGSRLFDIYGQALCMQHHHSHFHLSPQGAAPVLSNGGLSMTAAHSIVSIPAEEFAAAAVNSAYVSDTQESGGEGHNQIYLCMHKTEMPKRLRNCSGAVCVKPIPSVLENLIEPDGRDEHGSMKVISTGEGPPLAWLSCGQCKSSGVSTHDSFVRFTHHDRWWFGVTGIACRIRNMAFGIRSACTSLLCLVPTTADVAGIIAGLCCSII